MSNSGPVAPETRASVPPPSLSRRIAGYLVPILVVAAIGVGVATKDRWLPLVTPKKGAKGEAGEKADAHAAHGPIDRIKLTEAARANLGIKSKVVKTSEFWRTLMIPGTVIDRPAISDRGVTAPAMSVVTDIRARPGDAVKPGELLFGLRLVSEIVQNSQSELFKNARELVLVKEQVDRLKSSQGAIAGQVIIDKEQQVRRLQTVAEALRQELATRGMTREQIDKVEAGTFIRELIVVAPQPVASMPASSSETSDGTPFTYEVQELKVNLGDQVQAGQTLAILSNHSSLLVEGHAFRADAGLIERAAREGFPVAVEFVQDTPGDWPTEPAELTISHLANSVDPATRTTSFFLPLANQGRSFQREGKSVMIWRYRPGQRVKVRVPVEKMEDVIVLPPDAVTFDGPEAYVFRQNGDSFQRVGVHVAYSDATAVIVANDGQIGPGMFVAQSGAAALNRAVKAAMAGGGGGGHEGHDHAH
jgi:cobalt-zinc-cadmium efflux system membrane fusion protein